MDIDPGESILYGKGKIEVKVISDTNWKTSGGTGSGTFSGLSGVVVTVFHVRWRIIWITII